MATHLVSENGAEATCEQWIQDGWARHGDAPEAVMAAFPEGIAMAATPEQGMALAGLIVHVAGEHLGRWRDGVRLLDDALRTRLQSAMSPALRAALDRGVLTLRYAEDPGADLSALSAGDRVRVLAVAASALAGRNQIDRAARAFQEALRLAPSDLPKGDAVARTLAVTGNNLACAFEDKSSRSLAERELMVTAANAARKYWEIAGTWLEVERAEYRLAMTWLAAGDPQAALAHARACLQGCMANGADEFDTFYGNLAVAVCESRAGMRSAAEAVEFVRGEHAKLGEENRGYAADSVDKCRALVEAKS